MSSADTLLEWLDRAIDEAQAELGAEQSEFERLSAETLEIFDGGSSGPGWVTDPIGAMNNEAASRTTVKLLAAPVGMSVVSTLIVGSFIGSLHRPTPRALRRGGAVI